MDCCLKDEKYTYTFLLLSLVVLIYVHNNNYTKKDAVSFKDVVVASKFCIRELWP
jgi:hypothetical protein